MVALKWGRGPAGEAGQNQKQERRGGIEILKLVIIMDEGGLKQERRGGIEISTTCASQPQPGAEAGTPWWH